ncbi:alpha-L-fucosidase [Pontiellaceae bacterium B12227]|nr:alpha-L-fucosidase [Pontiellaceae bacterium B12227]
MNPVKYVGAVVIAAFLVQGCSTTKYEETWESMAVHEAAPEWFQDAKLGIYFHWGVYSVPAYRTEWYPWGMHRPGDGVYDYHKKTYGHPSEFGYHDFVPMFKAEHFDPEEWADLFVATGARFAGPVAEHHDGFAMWASKATPWNAAERGPKRDVLGELFQSLEKRDVKTIATFHHARNLQRYPAVVEPAHMDDLKVGGEYKGNPHWNSHYTNIEGMPPSSGDPELQKLYGNMPEEQWVEEIWLAKLKEVISQYQPDIIWFDSWLDSIPEHTRQEFCATYLNAAEKWNKDVVIVRKQKDLPVEFTVNDHEKSREPKALPEVWMTDDTISTGSWSYTSGLKVKPVSQVIHSLIDTVAKNGIMLLNVSPRADGVIPDDQRAVMNELGEWLKMNGEAIYETRPWTISAEGPTAEPSGGFADAKKFLKLKYTAKDIRYTRSKDGQTVYAMILGWPGAGETSVFEAFAEDASSVKAVRMLGCDEKLEWSLAADGLHVVMPSKAPDVSAVSFAIEVE